MAARRRGVFPARCWVLWEDGLKLGGGSKLRVGFSGI